MLFLSGVPQSPKTGNGAMDVCVRCGHGFAGDPKAQLSEASPQGHANTPIGPQHFACVARWRQEQQR